MAKDGAANNQPFDVAIIGGGLIGLQLALGLTKRNIPVTVYEQALELKEIGAGIGFSFNIMDCQKALDPVIAKCLNKVAIMSGNNVGWINGCTQSDLRLRPRDKLLDMELTTPEGELHAFTHRAHFLNELVNLTAPEQLKLGKRVDTIVDRGDDEKLLIKFCDGTTAEADAVIGCDGIKSRVRQVVLGEDDPSAFPHYAHESAYRCLIDMDKATPVLGHLAERMIMYAGHGAHFAAYPVDDYKQLNFAAFVRDDGEWPDCNKQTMIGKKEDLVEAFSHFGPTVRDLMKILPDELNRWAIFDTLDYPLSTFAYHRVALAGDAAHGSTPHHGAGAGMGVEDALVLATVLEYAAGMLKTKRSAVSKSKALVEAFEAYTSVRRERAQWLVASSRRQGLMVKWLDPEVGTDPEKFVKSTRERVDTIFYHDWKGMLSKATDEFDRRCQAAAIPVS